MAMIDDLMTLWWWRTTCRWSRDMNTSLSSYLDVTLSTWIQIVDQTWMFQPKSPFQIFSSFTLLALWGNRRETKARDEIKIKAVFHNTFVFRFWKYIAPSIFHHPINDLMSMFLKMFLMAVQRAFVSLTIPMLRNSHFKNHTTAEIKIQRGQHFLPVP